MEAGTVIKWRAALKNSPKSFIPIPLKEGENRTQLPYLSVYFSTKKEAELPRTGNFYIYVVLGGPLRLFTPSGILDYLPGQFSVSKIDTPASGQVLTFSEKGSFLAAAIELTSSE